MKSFEFKEPFQAGGNELVLGGGCGPMMGGGE
jgi:hypothetical protein